MTDRSDRPDANRISTDVETIREWAAAHGATPVRDEDDHVRIVDESVESRERVGWDEFSRHLTRERYVVIYYGEGAAEPLEVADREGALARSNVDDADLAERLDEGETVTSEMSTNEAVDVLPLSEEEIGKDVVDATDQTVGMVTDVADDGRRLYVDAEPGVTDRIKAALDWGDADEDDFPVEADEIDAVTRDEVRLKPAEDIDEPTPTP